MNATAINDGKVVQCIGAVVDIEFPREGMPKVYDALVLQDVGNALVEKGLTFEVQQQLGDGVVPVCGRFAPRGRPAAIRGRAAAHGNVGAHPTVCAGRRPGECGIPRRIRADRAGGRGIIGLSRG